MARHTETTGNTIEKAFSAYYEMFSPFLVVFFVEEAIMSELWLMNERPSIRCQEPSIEIVRSRFLSVIRGFHVSTAFHGCICVQHILAYTLSQCLYPYDKIYTSVVPYFVTFFLYSFIFRFRLFPIFYLVSVSLASHCTTSWHLEDHLCLPYSSYHGSLLSVEKRVAFSSSII